MNKWTEEEITYLRNNFKKYSKKELAKQLNKTPNSIQCKASKMGLKKDRMYFYNTNYFEEIDTPYKAYWLGFIYADGYVTSSQSKSSDISGASYCVGVELNKEDYQHLENFNSDINGNVKVVCRRRNESKILGKKVPVSESCSIRLYSKKMVSDLMSHGCCKNKSLIKKKPLGVPGEYMRDFIRGYFDGNGSITSSYNKKVNKSYLKVLIRTGSKDFADWLSEFLSSIGMNNTIRKEYSKNICYCIQIKSKSIKPFLNYLYKDSVRSLDRKFINYVIAVYGEDDMCTHKLSEGKIEEGLTANIEVTNRIA